jgi:hypothetical protein
VALDQVDRPAEPELADHRHGIGDARGVGLLAVAVGEAERQLEAPRHPAVVGLGRAAEPLAQVGAEARDAVLPDARDRGPELVLEAPGRLVERAVDVRADGLHVRRSDREQPRVAERRQDRELHLVIERAARQRIERLDGDGSSRGWSRMIACRKNRYGHAA